jgi:prolyl-tRNA synthetase
LQKEKDHIEGFAAEVAWITMGGKTKLEKPVAIRPTSETAMYKDFSDKIQSHRE